MKEVRIVARERGDRLTVAKAGATTGRVAATMTIAVADPTLARKLEAAVAGALRAAPAASPLPATTSVRSEKALAALEPGALEGRVAIVEVSERHARRLPALVVALRAAGPAGIQLVWDGVEPPRARVERFVFAALEAARGSRGAPVVLAPSARPAFALRIARSRTEPKENPC